MSPIFARKALLANGWSDGVRLQVAGGRLAEVEADTQPADGDLCVGIVIPGLTNAHSHAFQRALAGRTEERGSLEHDNFWTWRDRMYRLAGRVTAERLAAIARQLYSEMLVAGYTAVAEFHYLHDEPRANDLSDAMFEALALAAAEAGIRLTYVPVLYERAGFDQPEPTAEQRRFATTAETFEAHYRRIRDRRSDTLAVGIGAHSLRAVTPESLQHIAAIAAADRVPMHIHIAEQQREVEQCLAALHARPVRWLLNHCDVDRQWCLVHATHLDAEETEALAGSRAVVCLCPSTEANLGDGLFPLAPYLEAGGRIAIGSDSHVTLNPFEELRWLEYGQRLVTESRNVAAIGDSHNGRALFTRAVAGGAGAGGQGTGVLEKGALADLVTLDADSPMLAGHSAESLLDALVFSGFSLPIDRVMVHGEWTVTDGRHRSEGEARDAYLRVIRELYPEQSPGQ